MNAERWSRIGELFDAASSVPSQDREAWLNDACGGDEPLRAEVKRLLLCDADADRSGFLEPPQTPPAHDVETVDWPSARNAEDRARNGAPRTYGEVSSGDFAPRPAVASRSRLKSDEESRNVVQSRLRQLTMIYTLIFGMMLLLRPVVLSSNPLAVVIPYAIVAATLLVMALLLSIREFSLPALHRIELLMTGALALLLVVNELRVIIGPMHETDRYRAEKVVKNVILLVSLLIFIEATYVPKSWKRAAAASLALACLPLATLGFAMLFWPAGVAWIFTPRLDRNTAFTVFLVDTVFLLSLAFVSSYVAHTISQLRTQVIEARRFGQYRLGAKLGAGGMGEVYLAEHELLKRPCALKLIRPDFVHHSGWVERFEREVKMNAKLSHPNTVEIFDYGLTDDGVYYYVMEYLPGMSLAELVERYGPLPPGRAVYFLRQVALALREAHEAGLIHRDIKPSNIFAAKRGGMYDVAKLLDFGLVRPASEPHTTRDEGGILGTPYYMSPEQAAGTPSIDGRSDIYSLGAVAYYLLAGKPPYDVASSFEALIALLSDPIKPPSTLRPDLPDDLEAVIMRSLARHPNDRFPDVAAFEAALGRCACASSWSEAMARQWWTDHHSGTASAAAGSLAGTG
jgi:serine/threonine-protein kinase